MYAVQGNGNYVIPVLLFIPKETGKHQAVIYLNPLGKIADAGKGGPIEQLIKKGYLVIAPDLLGIGEVAPEKTFYDASYFISALTGKTLTATGSEDISTIVNFLSEREDVDKNSIAALAYDELCPVLLHAAVFNKSISSLVLIGSPVSFRSIVMNRFYDRNLAAYTVPGALTRYDLPDLIGCIAPRKIILAGIKDQMSQPAGQELINNDLKFPLSVYLQNGIPENIQIRPEIEDIGSMVNWCLNN
jgi:pimeloyl-ACP methyl ester carboxylesterase